ncbi:MAG TPA: GNAT family N-acetyltransferase [Steroidobacteraceae bacterium]|jgi:RimJ/RimL family protein N-acetyltransferase
MISTADILGTPRLQLRKVELSDGPFFLRLLNEPSWVENIGDRGVRSIEDAEGYIKLRIWAQYDAHGYGMYVVQRKADHECIGLCGLVRRDDLPAPDLGFALLAEWEGQGYATEAARHVMSHAHSQWHIERLLAIVKSSNRRSLGLLQRLGFSFERPYSTPQGEEIELYAITLG